MKLQKITIALLSLILIINAAGEGMIIKEEKAQTKIQSQISENILTIAENINTQTALKQTTAELDYIRTQLTLDEIIDAIKIQGQESVDEFNKKMPYTLTVSTIGRRINTKMWDYLHDGIIDYREYE